MKDRGFVKGLNFYWDESLRMENIAGFMRDAQMSKRRNKQEVLSSETQKAISEFRRENPDMPVVVPLGDGKLLLDDPAAEGVMNAVNAHNRQIAYQNCQKTLEMNADRVAHFKSRLADKGMSPEDAVIVLINVDTELGRPLADALMPGADWQQFRNQGQVPYARGLATRIPIQKLLDKVDKEAAEKLISHSGVAVVVVDHGIVEVFEA